MKSSFVNYLPTCGTLRIVAVLGRSVKSELALLILGMCVNGYVDKATNLGKRSPCPIYFVAKPSKNAHLDPLNSAFLKICRLVYG